MYRRVVISCNSFHGEWTGNVNREFVDNFVEEIIQVVLPCTVIREYVAPALSFGKMGLVYIIHPDVVESFFNRQPFPEDHQSCQSKPLLFTFSINGITTHVSQELLVVIPVEHMRGISYLELIAVSMKRRQVYIVHCIVFKQQAVTPLLVCIAKHGFHLIIGTVIVSFISPLERTF